MAEFGIRATQLTDPQGAGSQPLRPVQEPAGFTPDLSGLGSLFSGLVNKNKPADPWNAELDEFTKRNAAITQAQLTGDLSAASAKVQRNKLVTEFQVRGADAGWGLDYQKGLSQLVGYTATGSGSADADALVQEEKKAQQDLLLEAQKNGLFPTVTDFQALPPSAQQSILNAQQSVRYTEAEGKRIWEERQRLQSMESHGVAMTKADREARDEQLKWEARKAAGPMIRDAYGLIDANLSTIMNDSKLDDTQKLQTFAGSVNTMRSRMYEMLQGDPTTFQTVNQSLNDLEKLGRDMLDPTKRTEAMENEFKRRITEAKLWAIDGAKAQRAAGMAAVYPNSPTIQVMVGNVGMEKFNADLLAGENSKPLPSIVTGDIPTQKATFASAREAVRRASDGVTPDAEQTLNAAAQVFSSTVKGLTTFRAGQSNSMEYALETVASPEYSILVSKGKINSRDSAEAMENIVDVYVPSFSDSLRQSMQAPVGDTKYVDGAPSKDNATLMQLVDFDVGTDGSIKIVKKVSPEFRKGLTVSDAYIDTQVRKLQRTLEPRVNQLIRATAHLEGTTDYKSVFERVAPAMLRGFYAPASYMEQLKAQGYSGTGNVNNPANWRGTSGFPSQRDQDGGE